jgi:transcriptional regulator with XRE-family HTH domain
MYGTRIASLRNARNITQETFAKQLGITQNALSDIENDKRVKLDESLVQKIAYELGVTVADIKSTSPIVMNFTSHDYSHAIGQQHNQMDLKITEALVNQLNSKDAQIEKLITLLDSKK